MQQVHGGASPRAKARHSRPQRLTLKKQEALTGWLFVAPVMIGFLVFTAFSMLYSLYISFTDWNILSDPHMMG